jgi:hypothetical protein
LNTFYLERKTHVITKARYGYHLEDVVEILAMPEPLDRVQRDRLRMKQADIAEFEQAYPGVAKEVRASITELIQA